MGGQSRFLAILATCGMLLGLVVNLQNISRAPTRIEKFRSSTGHLSIPKGSDITLEWKVEGWFTKTWLNKDRVVNEDSLPVVVNGSQTYTLDSEGIFGRDSKTLTLTVVSGASGSENGGKRGASSGNVPSASLQTPEHNSPLQQPGGSASQPRTENQGYTRPIPLAQKPDTSSAEPLHRDAPPAVAGAQGYLTVRSNVGGTSITVKGIGVFSDGVADLSCFPGTYEVTASHPYLKTQVSSVSVSPGQHAQLNLALSLDQSLIQRSLNEATQQADGNDPRHAVKTARDILAADPPNLMARTILAFAYFNAHDMGSFYESAQDALRKGAMVYLLFMHHDSGPPGVLHQGIVVLRQDSIFFKHDLNAARCDLPQGVVPLRPGDSAEVKRDENGQVFLSLKLHQGTNSGRPTDIQLWQLGTQLQRRPAVHGTYTDVGEVAVSPPSAPQTLDTVAAVFRAATAQSR